MFCSQCGVQLKENAKFCHQCGAPARAAETETTGATAGDAERLGRVTENRSWLHTFGAFLLIPIFALVVVLLFWRNEDPSPPASTVAENGGEQQMPGMDAMNKVHETLERLQARVEENPRDVIALDSLAIMYSLAGSHEKAKSYYEQHLAIEPDNKDVKIGLALTYHNLNDDNKALALLQEILDKEPNYAFALHYMAEILAASHKHDEAESYWRKIINAYPNTEMAKIAQERIDSQHQEGSN